MEKAILNVKNLSVSIGKEKILDNLSFSLSKGDTLVVLGPNGAGKTVLLRALIGAFPHDGEVIWKEGVKIGYVPQRLSFIKDTPLSVKEFFLLNFNKEVEKPENRITGTLRSLGIDEGILEKKIGDISSGQFQRVLVGWALLGEPDVLLFDEPFAGIDVLGQQSVYKFLKDVKQEKNLTIILVSHELNIVHNFATKILCLRKKLVCFGSPEEILTTKNLNALYGEELEYHFH
jgi:zinc transport system ATP-binding protein